MLVKNTSQLKIPARYSVGTKNVSLGEIAECAEGSVSSHLLNSGELTKVTAEEVKAEEAKATKAGKAKKNAK